MQVACNAVHHALFFSSLAKARRLYICPDGAHMKEISEGMNEKPPMILNVPFC